MEKFVFKIIFPVEFSVERLVRKRGFYFSIFNTFIKYILYGLQNKLFVDLTRRNTLPLLVDHDQDKKK